MTFRELLAIASNGYKGGHNGTLIASMLEDPEGHEGDTLAQFVFNELRDTFDSAAADADQRAEARRVIQLGIDDLTDILNAL